MPLAYWRNRLEVIAELAYTVRNVVEEEKDLTPEELISALGGVLKEADSPFEYDGVEGFITKTGEESFELLMRPGYKEEYPKFNIAHMIGHLMMHMGYLLKDDTWQKWEIPSVYRDSVYYRYGHNIEEKEAYAFACAYMMPKETFYKVIREHISGGMYHLEPISKELNVPIDQVKRYGVYLGYFDGRYM